MAHLHAQGVGPPAPEEDQGEYAQLVELILSLPEAYRRVLELKFVEEETRIIDRGLDSLAPGQTNGGTGCFGKVTRIKVSEAEGISSASLTL